MARTKIAPLISDIIENETGNNPIGRAVRKEWRAVLDLYRKAEHLASLVKSAHANGGQTCASEWHLVNAVERLARLGQGKAPRPPKPFPWGRDAQAFSRAAILEKGKGKRHG